MVVVVDDSDLDGHAVEVDHAVDHAGGLGCRDTWEEHQEVRGRNKNSCLSYIFINIDNFTISQHKDKKNLKKTIY